MKTEILLAITDSDWELALGRAITANQSIKIGRRCVDLTEVLTMLEVQDFKLAIISSEINNLDYETVVAIEQKNCLIVGAFPEGNFVLADQLSELGIENIIGFSQNNPASFINNLVFILNQKIGLLDTPTSSKTIPGLISVWGTAGAPGRTALAIDIASALHQANQASLLIDADVLNPSIASSLGLSEDISGISAAIHLAQAGKLTKENLLDCLRSSKNGVNVLTGILNPDRWIEIRPNGLIKMLEFVSTLFNHQIIDLNSTLPDQREANFPEFDSSLRFSHVKTVLDLSEKIVFAVKATPLGVIRTAEVLQNDNLFDNNKLMIVVNQINDYSFGKNKTELISNVLHRFVAPNQIWYHKEFSSEYAKAWLTGVSGLSLIDDNSDLQSLVDQLNNRKLESTNEYKRIRSVA